MFFEQLISIIGRFPEVHVTLKTGRHYKTFKKSYQPQTLEQ